MATTNLSKSALSSINEKNEKTLKALEKGVKYDKSIDGVLGHITKFWNKGYGESIMTQCGIEKPKDFGKLFRALMKGEGIDSRMLATVKDKKGNLQSVIGLWSPKTLHNESDECGVENADGKMTYPTICTLDAKGKKVACKVDAIKPISLTPENAILFVVQNNSLLEGLTTPYTADDFMADYDIDENNVATLKEVEEVSEETSEEVCPTALSATETKVA